MPGSPGYCRHQARDASLRVAKPEHTIETPLPSADYGRSGFDVLRWLRTQPFRKQLQVVILSGSSEPDDREMAANLGADGYLVKPVSVDGLKQHLTRL